MKAEAGFSLAEMVAALAILSAFAVTLGEATQMSIAHWQKLEARIDTLRAARSSPDAAAQTEASLKSSGDQLQDADTGLVVAIPRLDQPADCVFDLVGRRCR